MSNITKKKKKKYELNLDNMINQEKSKIDEKNTWQSVKARRNSSVPCHGEVQVQITISTWRRHNRESARVDDSLLSTTSPEKNIYVILLSFYR